MIFCMPAKPSPERFLAAFPADVQRLANELRRPVKGTIPNITEAVYTGWQLIGYHV